MPKVKKVLFVLSIYKPNMGGVETSVESYCREYNKRGIKTVVLTKQFPDSLANYAIYDNTSVFRIPKPDTDEEYRDFFNKIIENDELHADIIHVVGVRRPLPLFALLLARKLHIPCMMTFVGGDVAEGPIWEEHKIDSVQSIAQADGYSAYSESIADDARRVANVQRDIPVIKTGLDLDKIATISPHKTATPYILSARRLVYDKGLDILIKAFAQVASKHPELKLLIAGEGEEEENLKNLTDKLGLSSAVEFLGTIPLEHLYAYMKGAVAHICPSRSEGGGNVNIEASACGCIPIGANIGGISEYIKDNETGLLFESENADDLAQKIIKTLNKPETNDRMIKNGLLFADSFSIEAQADKYITMYEELSCKNKFIPWSDLTKEFADVIES
ncbi:MAG: glycosyltransferase family 4 protein [Alphaproteobacteria bacterium]|nr:glycosyltransferase family 4 protein [Alphaproteobacteria bacterium]